jgi:hypothetical protein
LAVLQQSAWDEVVRAVNTDPITAGVNAAADDVAVCVKSGNKLTVGTPLPGQGSAEGFTRRCWVALLCDLSLPVPRDRRFPSFALIWTLNNPEVAHQLAATSVNDVFFG